jgi:hypothetical protein
MSKPDEEPGLICFLLPLPEPIGFPHHSIYEFDEPIKINTASPVPFFLTPETPPVPGRTSGDVCTSLRVWQYKAKTTQLSEHFQALTAVFEVITGVSTPNRQQVFDIDTSITVIEAVTRLLAPTEDGITEAFDRCVARVDNAVRAYGLVTGLAAMSVTKQRLPDVVIYMTKELLDDRWSEWSLLKLSDNMVIRYAPPDLDIESQRRVVAFAAGMLDNDPVLSYLELSAEARRAHEREGDTRAAAIYAETACEVLLDGVLQSLLWEGGISPQGAAAEYFTLSWTLARRVKSHATFAARLGGGHWTLTGDGPVAHWYSYVAALRNRCVHAGYRPSTEEIARSDKSKKELRDYVAKRLHRRQGIYPKTASLFTELAQRGADFSNDRKSFSLWLEEFKAAASGE